MVVQNFHIAKVFFVGCGFYSYFEGFPFKSLCDDWFFNVYCSLIFSLSENLGSDESVASQIFSTITTTCRNERAFQDLNKTRCRRLPRTPTWPRLKKR